MKILTLTLLLTCIALPQSLKQKINTYANAVSDYYNIPREITRAIIIAESDYDTNAVSYKNAYCVMQVTEPAYDDYKRLNPNTPYTNFNMIKTDYKGSIAVGCWYLKRWCYKYTGNWKDAITSYFWGLSHQKKTLVYYNNVISKSEFF
jgi:soluble lytic murein transglycosylase-like protein